MGRVPEGLRRIRNLVSDLAYFKERRDFVEAGKRALINDLIEELEDQKLTEKALRAHLRRIETEIRDWTRTLSPMKIYGCLVFEVREQRLIVWLQSKILRLFPDDWDIEDAS